MAACGQTTVIASGRPVSPSQQTMHTSATPRDLSSDSTVSQNLLDSPVAAPDPHAKHVLRPVAVDSDSHIDGPVSDHSIADLHHQRVDEDHRIHPIQRPGLPLGQFLDDGVGDSRDQVRRDLDVIHLAQVRPDVAGGHPARIQGDDAVVEPLQSGLALAHDLRTERASAVPRHRNIDRADVGEHRLWIAAITGVARPAAGRVVLVIA
jgi:hypothetical protein